MSAEVPNFAVVVLKAPEGSPWEFPAFLCDEFESALAAQELYPRAVIYERLGRDAMRKLREELEAERT